MLNWIFYPLSERPTELAFKVVNVFENLYDQIESESHVGLKSDDVLRIVADSLAEIGFTVERGKKASEKVKVPVLFGPLGKPQKTFEVDAYYPEFGFIVEIEAGSFPCDFKIAHHKFNLGIGMPEKVINQVLTVYFGQLLADVMFILKH